MSSAYDIVMDNRRELVDRLIAQMEKGYAATREAWSKTGRPYNPVSDAVYKGGNRFRLMIAAEEQGFADPRWMTFKQAQEQNYKIAAGSKGVLLEKWIFHKDVPKLDENQKPVIGADGKPELERVRLDRPVVNYFKVFNGEQILGLPELENREVTVDDYTRMAETFEKSSLCPISYENQDRAYYAPAEDKIYLPLREAFKNNETRLSVLLHEMAHSTGSKERLNRQITNSFGSKEYAREELNAELSSAFLEDELGISLEPDSEMIKDHANYVKSWIAVLRDDPNELFRACATAEEITGFLMKNYQTQLEMEMSRGENMRIKYFTRNLSGTSRGADQQMVLYERSEEALNAYRNAGIVDGKTLGVSINGRAVDLAWYDSVAMENILYRAAMDPKQYAPEISGDVLEGLRENKEKLLEMLQKENACVQLMQSVADIKAKSMSDSQSSEKEKLTGRFVSVRRPQDYIEINAENGSNNLIISTVHANEVVREKEFSKDAKDLADWLKEEVERMDTDYPQYGQSAFTYYGSDTWDGLEKHYEMLEKAGYDKNPSREQYIMNERTAISEDICAAGFKPTQNLINNIARFEQLEGKKYTLKELAELKQQKPDFKNQPEKKACFQKIVEECQSQERQSLEKEINQAQVEKQAFLKQEMHMEQSLAM